MATTYELIIRGKVQHVGFRDRVEQMGSGFGIDGLVFNKEGTVRIFANFESEKEVELFKSNILLIGNSSDFINIKEISTISHNTHIDNAHSFRMSFPKGMNKIAADDLNELNKKLDIGVDYIKLIFDNLKGKDVKLDKQTEVLGIQTDKLDKQTEVLGIQTDKLDKQIEMLGIQTDLLIYLKNSSDKQTEVLEKILFAITK